MLLSHQPGDTVSLSFVVKDTDTAAFETGQVHPVYATFALGRDAEWTTRQFVLHMKEEHEEGIGTFLHINHHSPALLGQLVTITGTITTITGNEIVCSFEASVNERLIAAGSTGQKIVSKAKLAAIFGKLK